MRSDFEQYHRSDLLAGWDNIVRLHCDKQALCDSASSYTYGDLDATTSAIAAILIAKGISAEKLVGLGFERPVDYVLGVFSVLKAGGAFVILDQALALVAGINRRLLLRTELWLARGPANVSRLKAANLPVLDIDSVDISGAGNRNWQSQLIADRQLAYVLFTSGSTGKPKGVMIERRGLTSFVTSVGNRLRLSAADRWLQIASPAFDVFLEETLPILTSGGTAICTGPGSIDFSRLHRLLIETQATIVEMTTPYWYEYRNSLIAMKAAPPAALRLLIVGGESMDINVYRDWQQRFSTPLIHVYGITETSVSSTMFDGKLSPEDTEVPIGTPLCGSRVSIRQNGKALPPGEEGDICIAGDAVGRGYLNDPASTAARFLPDPTGPPGSRVYLSGDRGAILANGEFVFRGRLDDQVKIRGHRLELSEVEMALRSVNCVQQACVLVDPSTKTSLIAFVVFNDEDRHDAGPVRAVVAEKQREVIKSALATLLPAWAIPGRIFSVKALPKTDRGKVDRVALAKSLPTVSRKTSQVQETAHPVTDRVLGAFRAALNKSDLGPDDDFFEFGGDSLSALTVVAELANHSLFDLSTATVFDWPTARKLARSIERGRQVT